MSDLDFLVVGAGPAAYAFASAWEHRKVKMAIVTPRLPQTGRQGPQNVWLQRSPKMRQPRIESNMLGWWQSAPAKIVANSSFAHVGLHGWGGGNQSWGASIGVFNRETLSRNGLNGAEVEAAYGEWARRIPIAGNENDVLRSRYAAIPYSRSLIRSNRVRRLDGQHCDGDLLVGTARVAVHSEGTKACVACNRCLSGCAYDSIWFPTRKDFEALGSPLTTIEGLVLELHPRRDSCAATIQTPVGLTTLNARKVVLACGPVMTFILLSKILGGDVEATLLHTPVIAFAFLAEAEPAQNNFGMANATFMLLENEDVIFFGNLFDGHSLVGYRERVFSDWKLIDFVSVLAARRLIFGAGFQSSDASKVTVHRRANQIEFEIASDGVQTQNYDRIHHALTRFAQECRLRLVTLRKGQPGIDIHYAGGIPRSLYDESLVPKGRLKGLNTIHVIGGANFSYLPPESPTFSFMANAWLIGRALVAE